MKWLSTPPRNFPSEEKRLSLGRLLSRDGRSPPASGAHCDARARKSRALGDDFANRADARRSGGVAHSVPRRRGRVARASRGRSISEVPTRTARREGGRDVGRAHARTRGPSPRADQVDVRASSRDPASPRRRHRARRVASRLPRGPRVSRSRLRSSPTPSSQSSIASRRRYNKRQVDFTALKDYNDYLEAQEDIIFNLIEGVDVKETEARVDAYRREHASENRANCKSATRRRIDGSRRRAASRRPRTPPGRRGGCPARTAPAEGETPAPAPGGKAASGFAAMFGFGQTPGASGGGGGYSWRRRRPAARRLSETADAGADVRG